MFWNRTSTEDLQNNRNFLESRQVFIFLTTNSSLLSQVINSGRVKVEERGVRKIWLIPYREKEDEGTPVMFAFMV